MGERAPRQSGSPTVRIDGLSRLPAESGEFLLERPVRERPVLERPGGFASDEPDDGSRSLPRLDDDQAPVESVAPSWTQCAEDYECFAHEMTRPFAEDAARLVHITSESLVLDVATGTGEFAIAAAARGADVLAADFSPRMLELLVRTRDRRRLKGIVPALMDGQNLQLASNQYHVAGSLFGLVFFGSPEQGLQEIHRVLRPGGQAVIGTWASPARVELMRLVGEAIMETGALPRSKAQPSDWTRLSAASALGGAMRSAGFQSVHVVEVAHVWAFENVDPFATAVLRMTPAWMEFHEGMTAAERIRFADVLAASFRGRQGGGPYAVTAHGLIAVGTKAG